MSERGVTQPGRVPVLGTGRRMFESCRPDTENIQKAASLLVRLFFLRSCPKRVAV